MPVNHRRALRNRQRQQKRAERVDRKHQEQAETLIRQHGAGALRKAKKHWNVAVVQWVTRLTTKGVASNG